VSTFGHIPVLPAQVLALLDPQPGETVLDCTAGLGGHATLLVEKIGPTGTCILNDLDPDNLKRAAKAVRRPGTTAPRVVELQGNFADAPRRLAEMGLSTNIVLADLGFSSSQMENAVRGLSFMREGPLDMRFDPSGSVTASELVNSLPEVELGELIREFGEDPGWRRITQKIVAERARSPITTTVRLAEIVRSAVPARPGATRIDPATRTFQALRIAVNDELGSLRSLLESVSRSAAASSAARGSGWLASGARIGIIAFHSLEDRMVKNVFGELVKRELAAAIGRGPVEATDDEVARNPRSRSAKMRVIQLGVDNLKSRIRVV